MVVTAIGLDPADVTMYALRHSSIVRALLRNVPIRLIASLHNTSVAMIEKHYSRYITEHSIDDIARAGLLSEPALAADNVVALVQREVNPPDANREEEHGFQLGGAASRA
jgi:hypothetical protein